LSLDGRVERASHATEREHVREREERDCRVSGVGDRALDADEVSGEVRAYGGVYGEHNAACGCHGNCGRDRLEECLLLRVPDIECEVTVSALREGRRVGASGP